MFNRDIIISKKLIRRVISLLNRQDDVSEHKRREIADIDDTLQLIWRRLTVSDQHLLTAFAEHLRFKMQHHHR